MYAASNWKPGPGHVVLDELGVVLERLDRRGTRARAASSATRNSISARRSPICAARTASAIVRLLVMRTTVLVVPAQTTSSRLAAANASGYQAR